MGKDAARMGISGVRARVKSPKKKRHLRRLVGGGKKEKKLSIADQAHAEIAAGKPGIGEAAATYRAGIPDTPGITEEDKQYDLEYDPIFKIKDVNLASLEGRSPLLLALSALANPPCFRA